MLDPDYALLTACAGVGVVAGLLGGLLGIGGGVVIVPALLLVFDWLGVEPAVATPAAVATSLATIIATSVAAARAQIARGAVDWAIVRRWTPGLLLGSAASGPVAAALPTFVLPWFLGAFLLSVSAIMLAAWAPAPHRRLPDGVAGFGLGTGAGLVSGLAGIGGGNVIVPTLVYFNIPMRMPAGTSSTLGFPIAVFGTLGFVAAGWDAPLRPEGSFGYVYVPAAVAIALTSFACAPLGVALAHRTPAARLKRLFGLLLAVVALRQLWRAWTG